MDIVLENNNFEFNGNNYLPKLRCNYACTFVGEFEEELLEKSSKKQLTIYRCSDDIWAVWTLGTH